MYLEKANKSDSLKLSADNFKESDLLAFSKYMNKEG